MGRGVSKKHMGPISASKKAKRMKRKESHDGLKAHNDVRSQERGLKTPKQITTAGTLATNSAGSSGGKTSSAKGKLSGETMKMKFMQRAAAKAATREQEESTLELGQVTKTSAAQAMAQLTASSDDGGAIGNAEHDGEDLGVHSSSTGHGPMDRRVLGLRQQFRWRLAVDLPKVEDDSNEEATIVWRPVAADLKSHVLSRRSFNGFNMAVERAYNDMYVDPATGTKKKNERVGLDVQSPHLNFYENRAAQSMQADGNGSKNKKKRKSSGGDNRNNTKPRRNSTNR
jgi:hypothetical protein